MVLLDCSEIDVVIDRKAAKPEKEQVKRKRTKQLARVVRLIRSKSKWIGAAGHEKLKQLCGHGRPIFDLQIYK